MRKLGRKASISIIGAGSAVFSSRLIGDICLTKGLWGSKITLMDINKERLNIVYKLAVKYRDALKAELEFETTTDRKSALEGADFVICAVKVGSYEALESERKIAEKYGYYRGIGDRVSDYYGGIGAYHQLKFFLELAEDMERFCPDAWLIESANPVFEGTTLLARETKIKVVGLCHGHLGYRHVVDALELDPTQVNVQMAGFNHNIWMTHFLYKGQNAYPLLDKWIEERAEEYWKSEKFLNSPPSVSEQMSPAAVEMYKIFELFPIGDTVRSVSPWWFHIDLKTKQRWYGPTGGFDSEIGWTGYLTALDEKLKRMHELATSTTVPLEKETISLSGEQHAALINAIVNDEETKLQLNIPNKGLIEGIPEDVVVEVPAIASGRGVQGIYVGGLPKRLMLYMMIPRMLRMERILQSFLEGDRKSLLLMLMDDPRTKSFEQAKSLLEDLFAQPWNSEAALHYK